jgi:hypothetical protein
VLLVLLVLVLVVLVVLVVLLLLKGETAAPATPYMGSGCRWCGCGRVGEGGGLSDFVGGEARPGKAFSV